MTCSLVSFRHSLRVGESDPEVPVPAAPVNTSVRKTGCPQSFKMEVSPTFAAGFQVACLEAARRISVEGLVESHMESYHKPIANR